MSNVSKTKYKPQKQLKIPKQRTKPKLANKYNGICILLPNYYRTLSLICAVFDLDIEFPYWRKLIFFPFPSRYQYQIAF